MSDSARQFYDRLAPYYHLIYGDWKNAVLRQGEALGSIIRAKKGKSNLSVLDCSCGIGTQAIGLAKQGYQVHATDLSPVAVDRTKREAEAFQVTLSTGVADLRTLASDVDGSYDVVISCDNSVPHLLSDEDVRLAVSNMWSKLCPEGLLIISIRDYDQIVKERRTHEPPRVLEGPEGKRTVSQVWEWDQDGLIYTLRHVIVREVAGEWQRIHNSTQYRVLLRDDLTAILETAGFSEIRWKMPAESGYFQPIVTAMSA